MVSDQMGRLAGRRGVTLDLNTLIPAVPGPKHASCRIQITGLCTPTLIQGVYAQQKLNAITHARRDGNHQTGAERIRKINEVINRSGIGFEMRVRINGYDPARIKSKTADLEDLTEGILIFLFQLERFAVNIGPETDNHFGISNRRGMMERTHHAQYK